MGLEVENRDDPWGGINVHSFLVKGLILETAAGYQRYPLVAFNLVNVNMPH